MKILLFVSFILVSPVVSAEHRVFQLKITDTRSGKSREVLSTLDPKQYVGYYTLGWYETITIVDHWMCWKRNDGYRPLCTRPFSK
ncbi:MAG: hypothetical protein K2Q26_11965 [Bdellovibrionales bacterium]|nr:hypothetical protein [Bdellovibrionales bacterium]